jgi:predicted PurR-regulated permease PerM
VALELAAQRSAVAWRTLGLRLRAITPTQLARGMLIAAAAGVIVWVVAQAWSQLLPFQLGLVLAYITAPIVNWLDRMMPRWLAAVLVVLGEVAVFVLLIAVIVPPLIGEALLLVAGLPDLGELQAQLTVLRAQLQDLPPGVQELIRNGLEQLSTNVRANVLDYVQAVVQLAFGTVLGLFGTLGFVIGFFGVPTWLVSVLSDRGAGTRAVNMVLPRAIRADFWAVLRILDRTFSAFVRGQLLLGVITGVLVYIGLRLLDRLELASAPFPLVFAVIAGLAQLVPTVGPIFGALPAVALSAAQGPEEALATLAMYVVVQLLIGGFIQSFVADRYVDIPPAIFVIVLVLLSQFGFLWVLLAAPISIVLRDLFRYVYGRLSQPPRPAGLLPGVPLPIAPLPLRRGRRIQEEIARG